MLRIVVDNSCSKTGASSGQMSRSKVFDTYWLRVNLPDLWRAYLRGRYGRAEDVAAAFGCTYQTALNWYKHGTSRPSADSLLWARCLDPEGFDAVFSPRAMMRAAEDRRVA